MEENALKSYQSYRGTGWGHFRYRSRHFEYCWNSYIVQCSPVSQTVSFCMFFFFTRNWQHFEVSLTFIKLESSWCRSNVFRFWFRQWNKALVMRCFMLLHGATLSYQYVMSNMLKGTSIGLQSTTRSII